MQNNFIEMTLRPECSPVNLLHIFGTPFSSNTSGLVFLDKISNRPLNTSIVFQGLRLPQKVSPSFNYKESFIQDIKEEKNPIRVAAKRLLQLEEGIERRYLKHPFKKSESADQSKDDTLKNSNLQETTAALLLWRKVVNEVSSGAQLSICINMLNECIGWEKSIMKVVSEMTNFTLKIC